MAGLCKKKSSGRCILLLVVNYDFTRRDILQFLEPQKSGIAANVIHKIDRSVNLEALKSRNVQSGAASGLEVEFFSP